ncbi:hypothetical protein [Streptomyces poriticola]|uniref:hypothetical protein n=1 Tax=Streptomyces poriticola TaxID=3120506 RepID=UPI002FCE4F56
MQPDDDQVEYVRKSWRRYAGAVDAMVIAEEAEDFQAVGIRCRETLLALVPENMDEPWVLVSGERPQAANAKAWFGIFATSLTANSKPRAYLKVLGEKTWDLSVWLQHYVDASEVDAEITLGATREFLRLFTLLRVRHGHVDGKRCPRCDSYQVVKESGELVEQAGRFGTFLHDECVACGWKSAEEFDEWPLERLQRLIDYKSGKSSPPRKSMEDLEVSDSGDSPQE